MLLRTRRTNAPVLLALLLIACLALPLGLTGCDNAQEKAAKEAATQELEAMTTGADGVLSNRVYKLLAAFPTGSDLAKAYLGATTYEVGEAKVENGKATVQVKLTAPKYNSVVAKALALIPADYTSMSTPTQEALSAQAGAAMAKAAADPKMGTATKDVTLTLHKDGDGWAITDDDTVAAVAGALWDGAIEYDNGYWTYTGKSATQLARLWVTVLCQLSKDTGFMAQGMQLDPDFQKEMEDSGHSLDDYYKAVLANASAKVTDVSASGSVVSVTVHVKGLNSAKAMSNANDAVTAYLKTKEAQQLYAKSGDKGMQSKVYDVLLETLASKDAPTVEKDVAIQVSFSGSSPEIGTDGVQELIVVLAGQGATGEESAEE